MGSIPSCTVDLFPGRFIPDNWYSTIYPARCLVSAGTGQPGVSVLRLGEIESVICSFCLSVAGHTIVCADPSLRYTSMLLDH